jgi:quercetin dioxygenase-like cupin family protein
MTNHHSSQVYLALGFFLVLSLFASCKNTNALPDPLEAGWKGEKVCELLEDQPKMRVLKCTFPPGIGHERHFHAEHYGYTLKGSTFKITDEEGSRTVAVPTGYSFYNELIKWHEVLNVGDSTAVFLIMEPK